MIYFLFKHFITIFDLFYCFAEGQRLHFFYSHHYPAVWSDIIASSSATLVKSLRYYWLRVWPCHLSCFPPFLLNVVAQFSPAARLKWVITGCFVYRFRCQHRRMVRHQHGCVPLEAVIHSVDRTFCFHLSNNYKCSCMTAGRHTKCSDVFRK